MDRVGRLSSSGFRVIFLQHNTNFCESTLKHILLPHRIFQISYTVTLNLAHFVLYIDLVTLKQQQLKY